jgi:hypothetical protein
MSIEVINQRQFAKEMDKISKNLGIDVVTIQKKLAFDIYGDVVAGTPVDTGRAMNNWNISVGQKDYSTTEGGGTASAIQSIKQAVALANVAHLQPFQTIWISNNLPYIGVLEEGHSDQAPNGWVERAVRTNLNTMGAAF